MHYAAIFFIMRIAFHSDHSLENRERIDRALIENIQYTSSYI